MGVLPRRASRTDAQTHFALQPILRDPANPAFK
jgi:hypothetical protein